MSHFVVLVTGEEIEAQLAPYDEDILVDWYWEVECDHFHDHWLWKTYLEDRKIFPESTADEFVEVLNKHRSSDEETRYQANGEAVEYRTRYNPLSKWDWYTVGGRWSGMLLSKESKTWVDETLAGDIDWDGMLAKATADAHAAFDEYEDGTAGIMRGLSWDQTRQLYPDIDDARRVYNADPWVQAVHRLRNTPFLTNYEDNWCVTAENPRAAYVARRTANLVHAYAILHEGQWISQGDMGWFGLSNDKLTNEEWATMVNELLHSLPADVRVTVVDCHI